MKNSHTTASYEPNRLEVITMFTIFKEEHRIGSFPRSVSSVNFMSKKVLKIEIKIFHSRVSKTFYEVSFIK